MARKMDEINCTIFVRIILMITFIFSMTVSRFVKTLLCLTGNHLKKSSIADENVSIWQNLSILNHKEKDFFRYAVPIYPSIRT